MDKTNKPSGKKSKITALSLTGLLIRCAFTAVTNGYAQGFLRAPYPAFCSLLPVVTDGENILKNGTVTAVVPQGADGAHASWVAQNFYQYSATIGLENIKDDENPDENFQPIVFEVDQLETWQETPTNIDTELDDVQP